MTDDRRHYGIDILVPCAGDARYVAETLQSIQHQRHHQFRVLVIDNACPHDRYADAVRAVKDERFVYVRHALRLPMTLNWQRCLMHVESPLFAMLHDDDMWPPDYLDTALIAFEEDDVLGAMTPARLFEGEAIAATSETTIDSLRRLADLPLAAQRVHALFSFLGHMSAFIGRRGPRGFPTASWWLPDQVFIDSHWIQGRCAINMATTVALRRHAASGTNSLSSDPMKTAENRQRFRQNAMEIIRNDVPGRYDLPEFVRTADVNLLVAICNACLQWPARAELHEFVRAVLRVPGAIERLRAAGRRGRALTTLPFWMITAAGILREGLSPPSSGWRPSMGSPPSGS